MNWLRKLLLTSAILVVCQSESDGQSGLLGNVESDASEYFLDFVASREDLTTNFVSIGRGKAFSVRSRNDKVWGTDLWFIDASMRIAGEDKRLSACSIKQETSGFHRSPIWSQTLIDGGKRYLRQGSPYKSRSMTASEDEDVPANEEGSATRRLTPVFDPFFLTFAEGSSFLLSRIEHTYGESMTRSMSFIEASRNRDGDLEGTWKASDKNGYYIDITFARDQGYRPTKVVWQMKDGPLHKVEDGKPEGLRITDLIASRWEYIEISNDRQNDKKASIWLPVEVSRSDFYPDGISYTDTKYRINWKQLPKEFKFSQPDDFDWRAPFAKLFDIDWSVTFSEFPLPVARSNE